MFLGSDTFKKTYNMCHKERELKELRGRGDSASTLRRKIVESVSSIERSFARRYNNGPKSRPQEKHVYGKEMNT